MKAKIKALESIALLMVIVLNIYLVYLNISINSYHVTKIIGSTANYIEVEEEKIEDSNPIIYDGKTLDELAEQIEKSLNSSMSGKGYLIVSYSIEKGVDPYMATAIILQETGCKWTCSRLVMECNNVGGQKGSGCGSYKSYNTLDEGIKGFIDNLYNNYVSYGLTTPETINPKYAEDQSWSKNVNKYIETIKAQ